MSLSPPPADRRPTPDGPSPRAAVVARLLLLIGFTSITYAASFEGAFHFDDYGTLHFNRAIRRLWPLDDYLTNSRPIAQWTFAVNYALHELQPFGYHVVNLAIHVTCGTFLFGLVLSTHRLMFGGAAEERGLNLATLVAAIWLVHPLATQAVTYICQRYESLAALGYLGVLWLLSRAMVTGRVWRFLPGVLLLSWVGFLSKETMATAPLAAWLYDWVFSRHAATRIRSRWPLYLAMLSPLVWFAPSVWRWVGPGAQSGAMGFGFKGATPWEYLRSQPEVLLHYLRLAVCPDRLCFDYGWMVQHDPWRIYGPGLVIVTLLLSGLWLLWRRRPLGWLIVTFFLILAPTSSIVPIADLAVEHRMYLPLAAVVCGVALGAARLAGSTTWGRWQPTCGSILTLVAVATVPLLMWRTHLRNLDYTSGVRLWEQTLAARPDNARAHLFFGMELHDAGRFAEAIPAFQETLRLRRLNLTGEAYLGLGFCAFETRDWANAEQFLRAAITNKQRVGGAWADFTIARAHNGLGGVYHEQRRIPESLVEFQQAADLGLPDARYNAADAAERLGRYDEAMAGYELLLEEQPQFTRAARRLAWLLAVR
ncbi:MAG: tetratricopeptide repeat protein [Planctomycetaceae bacterium]